jgi:hypothetical protein
VCSKASRNFVRKSALCAGSRADARLRIGRAVNVSDTVTGVAMAMDLTDKRHKYNSLCRWSVRECFGTRELSRQKCRRVWWCDDSRACQADGGSICQGVAIAFIPFL